MRCEVMVIVVFFFVVFVFFVYVIVDFVGFGEYFIFYYLIVVVCGLVVVFFCLFLLLLCNKGDDYVDGCVCEFILCILVGFGEDVVLLFVEVFVKVSKSLSFVLLLKCVGF